MNPKPLFPLIVGLLVSGCADHQTSTALPSTPALGDELSGILGQVLDEEMLPVQGANVKIESLPDAETTTGEAGNFSFLHLPPGEYKLTASKVGYRVATHSVHVALGEYAQASLVLDAAPVSVARQVTYQAEGYIELAVDAAGFWFPFNFTGTPTSTRLVNQLEGDAVTGVAAMEWEPSLPGTAKWMSLSFWFLSETLDRQEGPSPLAIRTDELAQEIQGSSNWQITTAWGLAGCGTDAAACAANPDTIAQVAVQQRTSVYVVFFHVDPAPDGFSPLPP